MAKRYFNWKLAIVLVMGFIVLGVTAFGLRRWQRGHRAEYGLEAGNMAYNEQRWEEAAQNLGRYLAVEKDDVPALVKYADAQLNIRPLKRNNIQQAIAAYRTALRVDKNNSEAVMQLTQLYLQIRMPGEAELIAKRYLERNPILQEDPNTETQTNQDIELHRMLAVALASQRKFTEAAAELKAILQEHPEQILAYETLGQLTEQRPEDLVDPPAHWFDQAVKNNPSSALAYIIRAGFYLRSRDRLKALADLEQAEKLDLSDTMVRLRLAREFIDTNALDKAEEHLAAAQTAEPTNQTLWQLWAQLALRSESQAKMLKTAETGLKELSSQPWDFMPTAAELFIRCDQLDHANECISKLRQKDIAPATVAFLEGLVADKKGHSTEAVKCWRQAMGLGYESQRIRLVLASAMSRLGDTQSALSELRKLVSERPNFFDGRLLLARLLAQTGNWAEAAEQTRMAGQIYPGSLEAALLHIRARIQLLAEAQTDNDSPLWQDIERQLATLEDNTDGALSVKLVQFQLAIQRDDFTAAKALVDELKKSDPPQVRIALIEAELLAARGKEDEAILMLSKTVEEFPDAVEPVSYLAILLARQGNREKCEAIIKDSLARIEQPIVRRELGLLLAGVYTRWREQDKAYELLNTLVQKQPNDIPCRRRLLRCRQVTNNPEQAQQLVNDIKTLEGEDGWQWRYEQAKIWFEAENFRVQYPQIVALLKENLLANPDDQSSRVLLAGAYERAGELQLAVSTYREALNRSPRDIRVIAPAVAALYRASEFDLADEILRRAADEKLAHPELERLELQSHLRRGELNPATDILENLLANDPNNRSVCLSLANLKMQQGRLEEARQLLDELKMRDPNSLPVTYAQIQLNLRQNKPIEAIRFCNEVVNNLGNASAYILRARTYATLGQNDKAAEDLNHIITIEPNNVGTWVARSDFYSSVGRLDKAAADIQKALSLVPDGATIQKRAIRLFQASGDPDKVRQGRTLLDKALKANPQDGELRFVKARSLLAEGTAPAVEEAGRILQKLTEDQPKVKDAWVILGELALGQGQPGKAIDIALRGLVHTPNDKALLLLKARAEAMRFPSLAIPTLKALRELEPNDVDVAVLLAGTYVAANVPEKAVSLLRNQLNVCDASDSRRCNIALAVALHKSGNKTEAQKIFHSLSQSAPDDPGPLLTQVRLLRDDKLWNQLSQRVSQWCENHAKDSNTPVIIASDLAAAEDSEAKKTAEDLLRRVLEREPNHLPAINTLAVLLQMTDRPAESAALYQQILKLQPDNVIAMNNLAWIMCEEQGKYEQALELAQRGLKKTPNYVDLIDTRGVAYYRLGEFDKAVRDFTRSIELYPDRIPSVVASYFHLGRALTSLGRKEEAIENLKKASELNTEIGGLSTAEVAEAKRLVKELSPGS